MWHYFGGGVWSGPTTLENMRELVATGRIRPIDLVSDNDLRSWRLARDFASLWPIPGDRPTAASKNHNDRSVRQAGGLRGVERPLRAATHGARGTPPAPGRTTAARTPGSIDQYTRQAAPVRERSSQPLEPPPASVPVRPESGPESVTCSVCKAKLLSYELARHLSQTHKIYDLLDQEQENIAAEKGKRSSRRSSGSRSSDAGPNTTGHWWSGGQ